jgi:hypothetical protein
MSIVKIEIENDKIISINGNDVTIMVVDYDEGTDTHKNRRCKITIMDYTSRKEIREPKLNGISDFPAEAD